LLLYPIRVSLARPPRLGAVVSSAVRLLLGRLNERSSHCCELLFVQALAAVGVVASEDTECGHVSLCLAVRTAVVTIDERPRELSGRDYPIIVPVIFRKHQMRYVLP
jgi:hypothetical protein